MHYKAANRRLQEIARELNVESIVEGSVVRSGNRVRITAQLIYVPTEQRLWGTPTNATCRTSSPCRVKWPAT
jgi:TolB-like protein